MAYQVGATCYGSAEQALSATASSQVGGVVVHSGVAYVVDVAGVSASSITFRLNPIGGGVPVESVVSVTPQPCGLLQWDDGLLLGWSVATAWILTAAVMFLRKAAHQ